VLEFTNGSVSSPSPGVARVSVGGGGGTDNEYFEKVNFTYQTASPLFLQGLSDENVIDVVTLVILTPFDDVAATLTCGTDGTPALVFSAGDVTPGQARQYGFEEKHEIAGAENLRLFLSPAGSTQGAGYVLFRVKR